MRLISQHSSGRTDGTTCSALLQGGLPCLQCYHLERWALTPPFHPCLHLQAVCFLWRYPSSGNLVPDARDFSRHPAPGSPELPLRALNAERPRACCNPLLSSPRINCLVRKCIRIPIHLARNMFNIYFIKILYQDQCLLIKFL